MAEIETIGFAHWVQPADSRFASVARFIPQRVAHPPPWFPLADVLRPTEPATPSEMSVSTPRQLPN